MTDLVNLEVAESLRTLRAHYPDDEVQVWVKWVRADKPLYFIAAVGDTYSLTKLSAHEAVEETIDKHGSHNDRKQARIKAIRAELASLGATASGDE